ncbi:RNA-directed DNA polymerase from mobile element jockey [Holothuria leucospilota]|uniref:RNA-directed DNA polymerase from mobile element jockey n=1 Tax=Holothuria leucospilota TaxID=206669 RepID=A0A9Q1CKP9_HOLLE|nr:RNA-directed DNA polymerase from mobile element jockey [Holothuria leucospilota]
MFPCMNFHWIAKLVFIIITGTIRIQKVSPPFLDDLPDLSRDHWTILTVINDNLSLTSYLCNYGVSCKLPSSHSTTLSGLIQHKHKLSHKLITTSLLLILAGDIASNPGPCASRKPRHPCVHCSKGVTARSKAVSCDSCERWVHIRCTYIISDAVYDTLVADGSDFNFLCNCCTLQSLPFGDTSSHPDVNDMNIDIANTDDGRMTKPSAALDEQFECFNQKGLHFIHLNVRSLIPKLSELKLLAVRTKATIIALSETWLDDSVTNAEISIEGYSVLRRDRNRNDGGVCLYVSNKVAFNSRLDLNCDQTEAVWVDLLLPKSKPITVCSGYRPPDDYNFISALEVTISHIRADCELIILGDLNIDFLRKTGPLYDKLNCLLSTFACKQVIDSPTRVTDSCSSLLDHIICNNDNKLSQSGTISIGLSDHFLIYCTRKRAHKKQVSHHHNTIKVRSLKHYSKQSLVTAITTTDWSEVYCSDVDKAWCVFKRIFTGLIDNIAPIKEIRLKKRTEPWMTSEILDSIRLRDQLLHRFKRDRNQDLYSTYTKIRNKVQRDVKHAKSKYFLDKIAEDKANPRKLWQHLKSLGYSSTPDNEAQIVLNIDGEVCSAPKGVANYINDFFTKISSSLVKDLPQPTGKFDFDSSAFKNYYNKMNVVSNSFKLCKVSTDFVYNEICALKISKGTGLDGIPARFIKDGADVLKDQLTHIINLSIETSTVPLDFKYARVKPLFKKQSRLDVSNYRPISILSVASKLLEKAIFTQMEKYLKENNILYGFQSGFRGGFSTETCLVHLSDYIRSQSSLGNYTGMVLIDLQKAFDTVDHNILCSKLRAMGFSNVDWFKSYLGGRRQLVSVNGVNSDPTIITCGVPQGSILGPLLFLCYVNDMPISVNCKLLLYADDSALIVSDKDVSNISSSLSNELESCREWLVDNKLSLHLGKTESILFGSKAMLKKSTPLSVSCNGNLIKPSNSVKYLGIVLDETLSGEHIVCNILKKAGARLKFLYRHSNSLNRSSRKILCSALIQCYLDYSCTSWYSAISQHYKNKLQILQNKIVRFILDRGPRFHIGQAELDSVGFLSVDDRVQQLKLNLVFKIFHDICPGYLKFNFTRFSAIHQHCTRGSPFNFLVPKVKGLADRTFFFTAINHWNALPNSIKQIKSTHSFKLQVKTHLANKSRIVDQNQSLI